ncbi:MAG: hypothetical protein U0835_12490 [Isosphaeraceae bacterium]
MGQFQKMGREQGVRFEPVGRVEQPPVLVQDALGLLELRPADAFDPADESIFRAVRPLKPVADPFPDLQPEQPPPGFGQEKPGPQELEPMLLGPFEEIHPFRPDVARPADPQHRGPRHGGHDLPRGDVRRLPARLPPEKNAMPLPPDHPTQDPGVDEEGVGLSLAQGELKVGRGDGVDSLNVVPATAGAGIRPASRTCPAIVTAGAGAFQLPRLVLRVDRSVEVGSPDFRSPNGRGLSSVRRRGMANRWCRDMGNAPSLQTSRPLDRP